MLEFDYFIKGTAFKQSHSISLVLLFFKNFIINNEKIKKKNKIN